MQRVIEIHAKLNKEDKGNGGGAVLVARTSDSEARVRPGVAPHSGHYVMSFSKTNLLPKSAGNTQEAVALSQHDCKIVYRDVKDQMNQTNQQNTQHISCQVY